jgi:serine protease Do
VKRGDVIIAVDGKPVETSDEVVRVFSSKEPGSSVKLTVNRAGKTTTLTARLADRGEHVAAGGRPGAPEEEEPGDDPKMKRLGITVDDLTPQIVSRLGLPADTTGVVVTSVARLSEAFEKQIGEGDVITEVNRVPVASVADYRREIRKVKEGGLVVFYVISPSSRTGGDAVSRYVTVRLRETTE